MAKLKPEIKAKWLSALRDGEYEQTAGALRNVNNEFCCLGVLTDLYLKEHNINWINYRDEYNDDVLSKDVSDWAFDNVDEAEIVNYLKPLDEGVNPLIKNLSYSSLTDLNDYGSKTFKEIADIIDDQM